MDGWLVAVRGGLSDVIRHALAGELPLSGNDPHVDVRYRLTGVSTEIHREVPVDDPHPRDLAEQAVNAQPEENPQPKNALLVPLRDDHVRPRHGLTVLDNQIRPGRLSHDLVAADLPTGETKETIAPLPLEFQRESFDILSDLTKKGSDLCSNHGTFPFPISMIRPSHQAHPLL